MYYYNPRKYVSRQDKWSRKFTGPFLVIGVPGPVNVKLQRSRRARPFYAHVDKVKPYESERLPKSWLSEPAGDEPGGEPAPAAGDVRADNAAAESEVGDAIAGVPSVQDYRTPRPRRQAGRPRRYME